MNIFDPDFPSKFELFTTSHLTAITVIALFWIIIPALFRKWKNEKADQFFRFSLATLLLGQQLVWLLWEITTQRFTIQLSLPFNLCDISNLLCAVLLITKNYKLFEVLYFYALAGTIQSYITPNIYYAYPHIEFIVFYIQHGGEILTILYMTIVLKLRPHPISILKANAILLGYVILIYFFNYYTGSNYLFLMGDTPHPSTVTRMIAFFGEPPRHIIGLGLVSVFSILILYIPFLFIDVNSILKKKHWDLFHVGHHNIKHV